VRGDRPMVGKTILKKNERKEEKSTDKDFKNGTIE
jgi:hypothetical protein